jgi:hypothetical protein
VGSGLEPARFCKEFRRGATTGNPTKKSMPLDYVAALVATVPVMNRFS